MIYASLNLDTGIYMYIYNMIKLDSTSTCKDEQKANIYLPLGCNRVPASSLDLTNYRLVIYLGEHHRQSELS